MHLLEKYSLSVGAKISEPYTNQHFFPIPEEDYIIFSIDKYNYIHWRTVLFFCKPVFDSINIKTIQIGPKNSPDIGCTLNLSGEITLNQTQFLIKNSKIFVGECGLMAHISCYFDVPSIVLFGSNQIKHMEPFWKPKKYEPLCPNEEEFVNAITPQSIKKHIKNILPENICEKIFTLLEVDAPKYKTVFFGDRYVGDVVDIKPTDIPKKIPAEHVNIRADKGFKNEIIEFLLLRKKCELTLSEKIKINTEILRNAHSINYVAEEFDKDFINQIKKSGVKYTLICSNKNTIAEQRLTFFDEEIHLWDIESYIENKKIKEKIDINSLKIISNKKILVGDKIYSSWWQESGEEKDLWIDKDWVLAYIESHG